MVLWATWEAHGRRAVATLDGSNGCRPPWGIRVDGADTGDFSANGGSDSREVIIALVLGAGDAVPQIRFRTRSVNGGCATGTLGTGRPCVYRTARGASRS